MDTLLTKLKNILVKLEVLAEDNENESEIINEHPEIA